MDEEAPTRRCLKLRRCLHGNFSAVIPVLVDACTTLRAMLDEDCDLDKYLDVSDLSQVDLHEACSGFHEPDLSDDADSLKLLRVWTTQTSILRRGLLCYLLSLSADSSSADYSRWSAAVAAMRTVAVSAGSGAEQLHQVLLEDERELILT